MLFKDHLKIVTDAGAVLHLGWDYDAPYFLDPLNGVSVDLKTAQSTSNTFTVVIAAVEVTPSIDYANPSGSDWLSGSITLIEV